MYTTELKADLKLRTALEMRLWHTFLENKQQDILRGICDNLSVRDHSSYILVQMKSKTRSMAAVYFGRFGQHSMT